MVLKRGFINGFTFWNVFQIALNWPERLFSVILIYNYIFDTLINWNVKQAFKIDEFQDEIKLQIKIAELMGASLPGPPPPGTLWGTWAVPRPLADFSYTWIYTLLRPCLTINSNTFQEELSQLDNEILELNLDEILQQTNNSAQFNTITMPPSTCISIRFKGFSNWKGINCVKKNSFSQISLRPL
jgi:hypothetical protein